MGGSYLLLLLCSSLALALLFNNASADIKCQDNVPFHCNITSKFNSSSFKHNFIFGAATSAYQIEGGAGRGFNIWDSFTHRYPEKTKDGTNADIAVDSYHLYMQDVAMLKKMGLGAYRLSIAWSRVLPKGRVSGGINKVGVDYYNNLINALKNNGIEPFVTLYHWDLPQTLEDEYNGFLSPRIVKDYLGYVDLCFKLFGDRVKNWITLNQPYTFSRKGYGDGSNAPGRCSAWQNLNCTEGDSGTEPYLVSHHQLIAHAEAVHLYRTKYKKTQKGKIGTTLIARWYEPLTNSTADRDARQRALDFMFGWFMDPLTTGDYPPIMKKLAGNRLPKFTLRQSILLKGSLDFLGLNYYVTEYAFQGPNPDPKRPSYLTDARVSFTSVRNGVPIGPKTATFFYHPSGLKDVLVYIKEKYHNPLTYITENGFNDVSTLPIQQTLADYGRIDYICSHLCFLGSAIKNGSNVAGYFTWSLLDNYEFGDGFTVRFGMNYIDYNNVTDRRPKMSAKWMTKFVNKIH